MDKKRDYIYENIIHDMLEGVVVLGPEGTVEYLNASAESILGKSAQQLIDKRFASVFFQYRENDAFNQAVLDAFYKGSSQNEVPFFTGTETRQLQMMTSILWRDGRRIGTILVLTDITEFSKLKQQYVEQIERLLKSLVRALSTAIDERSHYTAKHTRNMVHMGEAFLHWIDENEPSLRFTTLQKRAFLMSVWLHDVGKIAVPLSVMDKATRLGPLLGQIENRFEKMHLLSRIACLENRITEEEWKEDENRRKEWLTAIRRINLAGVLRDEDLDLIHMISQNTYQEEDGSRRPVLLEEETEDLMIQRGTLSDKERQIMQGHVTMTKRILDQVRFPDGYTQVPEWASAHHELLNGKGYPDQRKNGEIPMEVRLLTILDIYEALTAPDRPYKKPMDSGKAFDILNRMAEEGSIDGKLLQLFFRSHAYDENSRQTGAPV